MSCRSGRRSPGPTVGGLLIGLLVLLPLAGCGKKGNPQPPLRQIPAPVRDLTVEQRGPRILLNFTYPKLTPAGTALEGVSAVEVWEVVRPLPAGGTPQAAPRALQPREFTAAARQRLRMEATEVGAATAGDRVVVALPLPEPLPAAAEAHYFTVRTAGPRGDVSEHSNPVVIVPRTPPEAPREVRVTPRADGVQVEWEAPPAPATAAPAAPSAAEGAPPANPEAAVPAAPADSTAPATPAAPETPAPGEGAAATPAAPGGLAGYNVYRRSARERNYGAPVQTVGPEQRSAVDSTARFGESYIYTVTAVAQRSPLIESAVQSEHEVRYQDRFPPPVPREPLALVEEGRVRLVWRSSDAPDLAGYLVYRSDAGGPFARLTERPVAQLELADPGVTPGEHVYRVTAVDQLGNESAPAEVAATVTRPGG